MAAMDALLRIVGERSGVVEESEGIEELSLNGCRMSRPAPSTLVWSRRR